MIEHKPLRLLRHLAWIPAIWIAWELLHYEQYKLLGNPGSVFLFTVLTDWLGFHGYEKAMRLGVGAMEIAASILVLIPRTQGFGGLFAMGVMSGAIFFHTVSPLGIDPYSDGGVLFKEACLTWAAGLLVAVLRRDQLVALFNRIAGRDAAVPA
ncbi:DoxX family protein [Roseomonas hellenica]|uniref:DoxX family protein n=1 Tax=Plastoroseomonas hellenica TaxID=2687306 RepID=A0ABS5EWK6_9PROT|nr:hypothetical protein [Plastoroseomonas hellenica]MBR0664682.1 DoxX family protein [Plastoroseomonas hellenica]